MSASNTTAHRPELEAVRKLLLRLQAAYTQAGLLTAESKSPAHELSTLLLLSDALLRNVASPPHREPRMRRVAVFGGTQVGKSTMVNVLAGSESARVYHTAGFTRHAQAFTASADCAALQREMPNAFPGFTCVSVDELSLDRPDEFAVAPLAGPPAIPDTVFWDAPDCDAVDAARYRRGMLEAITVADAVVYVTSREKYAVNGILEWVLLLMRAGIPIVSCVNMTPAEQQPEIQAAMQQALRDVAERSGVHGTELPTAVAFDYLRGSELKSLIAVNHPAAQQLRESVNNEFKRVDAINRSDDALRFLSEISEQLTTPALLQAEALAAWNTAVDIGVETFVADYRSSYLDNPQRYDAFNRVGVEILALLNPPIPGLRKALIAVRTVLSLPARAIIFSTRAAWRYLSSAGQPQRGPTLPNEVVTFQDANDQLLNSLAGLPVQRQHSATPQPFWAALGHTWRQTIPQVQQTFKSKLEAHRARTDEWVRETAQGIYQELARDPIKLNLLRTGRIAADAGAIVVSIHTGGHGDILHDVLVTPAMMALVEAITQQLASSYVEQRRRELRERLLADTQQFAQDVYAQPLKQLGEVAWKQAGFADLDVDRLRNLRDELENLRYAMKTQARHS